MLACSLHHSNDRKRTDRLPSAEDVLKGYNGSIVLKDDGRISFSPLLTVLEAKLAISELTNTSFCK